MKRTIRHWEINLKHAINGKLKTVRFPGGLLEAEARRSAVLKTGDYWRVIGANRIEEAAQSAMNPKPF